MPRFFVPPDQIRDGRFHLLGSEAHHAATVLRRKAGDVIKLFDGRDASFRGRIEYVSDFEIRGVVLESFAARPSTVRLVLGQGLLKGPKWDWLIEKACEVGVSALVPLITARTVVHPAHDHIGEKLERWRRIALAASKQSGRSDLMDVIAPIAYAEWWRTRPAGELTLIPWEKEERRRMEEACAGATAKTVVVLVGPEGGWEQGEVALAQAHGAVAVRLGPTLLRSETAGIISAVLVLREYGVY